MKKNYLSLCLLFLAIISYSCLEEGNKREIRTDTKSSGKAKIVADGTLTPVVQELVDVFESTYPEAIIIPIYTDYKNAYSLLVADSVGLIIGPRELTIEETQVIKERKQTPRYLKLAVDGIALIANKANTDTLITTSDIKRIMRGEIRSWKELNPESPFDEIAVVFDSPSSSTVKYIRDSICKGLPIDESIRAISNDTEEFKPSMESPNQRVLDYVASTPNALGVIGVNWISNPTDELKWTFINKINVMNVSIEEKAIKENSYPPLPYQMALNLSPEHEGGYPLTREVYMIITDVRGGLPSGFYDFAAKDKGQRLIYRAGLLPARAPLRMVRVIPE